MADLKPGPDLDVAVGRAAGLGVSVFDFYAEGCRCVVDGGRVFEPSVDLNAAFEAAERAGMFLELHRLAGGWMATTYVFRGKCVTDSTASLAICAAILKLRGVCR